MIESRTPLEGEPNFFNVADGRLCFSIPEHGWNCIPSPFMLLHAESVIDQGNYLLAFICNVEVEKGETSRFFIRDALNQAVQSGAEVVQIKSQEWYDALEHKVHFCKASLSDVPTQVLGTSTRNTFLAWNFTIIDGERQSYILQTSEFSTEPINLDLHYKKTQIWHESFSLKL